MKVHMMRRNNFMSPDLAYCGLYVNKLTNMWRRVTCKRCLDKREKQNE